MGTILIPVPVLGATVGGVVGSVGGKLIGGVSGIALSKILEVHDKMRAAKVKKMTAIPQLMANISPESELMRGLMNIALDPVEEQRIASAIEDVMDSRAPATSLYPSLEEFLHESSPLAQEKCRKAQELSTELFTDENYVEYFVLTPVPDENAPEEFASSADLLVLRWPNEAGKPWESDGEKVLDIDELNTTNA